MELAVEIAELKREVGQIREELRLMKSMIAPEEIASAMRLRAKSPTNSELKLWAEASVAPEHLEPEELPW